MISSKKELDFYIAADNMMNRGSFKRSFKSRIKDLIFPDYIMRYLRVMRKLDYYSNKNYPPIFVKLFYNWQYKKLSIKLGFSIGHSCFGYGLVIPHYGTIVVGSSCRIGKYAVLHSSTCISNMVEKIGDGLYLATGAKITSKLVLRDNVSIGANSVVNKTFDQNNIMIAGTPAKYIKDTEAWYIRDGEKFRHRVELIEKLKESLNI